MSSRIQQQLKPLELDLDTYNSLDHIGYPQTNVVDVTEILDPDLSSESTTSSDSDSDDNVAASSNDARQKGVETIQNVVQDTLKGTVSSSLTQSGSINNALTMSQQRRKHVHLGNLGDLREMLNTMINRYQAQSHIVTPLLNLREQIDDTLKQCDIDPDALPTSKTANLQESLRLSAFGAVANRFRVNDVIPNCPKMEHGALSVMLGGCQSGSDEKITCRECNKQLDDEDHWGCPACIKQTGCESYRICFDCQKVRQKSLSASAVHSTADGDSLSDADTSDSLSSDSDSDADDTMTPSKPSVPTCTSLHTMKVVKQTDAKWLCDECRSEFEGDEERWRCDICDYDICYKCQPSVNLSELRAQLTASLKINNAAASSSAGSSAAHAAAKEAFTCPICFDDFEHPSDESFQFSECQHLYCKDCVDGYLSVQINDGGVLDLTCPDPSCGHAVTPQELEVVLDPDMFARYQQFTLLANLQARSDVMWCPAAECDNYHENVDFTLTTPLTCSTCQMQACRQCKGPFHQGVSCDKAEKRRTKDAKKRGWRQRRREKKNRRWQKKHTKPCAKCGALINKNGGCKHMTCRAPGCGYEFCWNCLGEWNGLGGYDHNCFLSLGNLKGKAKAKKIAKDAGMVVIGVPLVVVGGAALVGIGAVCLAGAIVLSPIMLLN
mmetsp:Transcript_9015/g.13636  ORF Transcript_9015/g.13636 Transcript_9015/m.13636 type:complete len:666 (+) Transcript_9015:11-2008(+)